MDGNDPSSWSRRAVARLRDSSRRGGARLLDELLGLEPSEVGYTVERDLAVPMPDGVSLVGDHYRPAGAEGPLPVVLLRLPYGKRGLMGAFGTVYSRHGFQVFLQATRGTFGSGGQFRPFTTEHEDGLATIAWLREQPWCDGRVAMTGASYFGHTQWAVAPYVDPPLECVAPHITAARISAAFYDNGVPQLQNALEWSAEIGRQETRGAVSSRATAPIRKAKTRRAARRLPLQAVDVAVAGAPVVFWRDFVDHADAGDEFWSVSDHSGADLGRMPPTSMVTGWWDLFVREQLADYSALRAAGVAARIVVGPWQHAELGEVKQIVQTDLVWLRHHLAGGPAPSGAPVRVNLLPTETWLEFETWPPPDAQPRVEFLCAGGTLTGVAPTGADVSIGSSRFTYDPADPTPSVGGPLLTPPGKQEDNDVVERRADVLLFTGEPLEQDLDVVGPVRARIHLRIEHPQADLFVRLCDVDDKQVSRNVVDGIRRISPDLLPADDVTVGPDGVLTVDLALFPTAYRFKAGHRLRIQVTGGAFPRYARSLGTTEPFGSATAMRANTFEVLHDAQFPSHVELSVLPAVAGES